MQISQYKQDLDTQIQNKKVLQAYGNMTNVEKEMNKDDLIAWKKYDNNQYSMIPGISHNKKLAEQRAPKQFSPQVTANKAKSTMLNEGKLRMQEERLAQYGLLNRPIPNTRHERVPVDTNSKGTIDLANVQINASLGKAGPSSVQQRLMTNESPQSQAEAAQVAPGMQTNSSRNAYNDAGLMAS